MKGGTRKRGSTWSYYFDLGEVGGKRRKKEKGGFSTRKEAEAALAAAINEFNVQGAIYSPSDITLSDYLDLWYQQYVLMNCKPHTQMIYKHNIDAFYKPELGNIKIKSLTPTKIQNFINEQSKKGYSKSMLHLIFVTLSSALRYAVQNLHYIQYNPASGVKVPKNSSPAEEKKKILSKDELSRIFKEIPESSPLYLPVMLSFNTGMRLGECIGLTWDRIDLKSRTITIDRQIVYTNDRLCFGTPKTLKSIRVIKFGNALYQILCKAKKEKQKNRLEKGTEYKEYFIKQGVSETGATINKIIKATRGKSSDLEIADFLCVKRDGTLESIRDVEMNCRKISEKTGIYFHFHELRHTHATMLIEGGAPIKDVQERLGHADVKTTMNLYVHDTDAMKDQSVEIFDRISRLA